VKPTWTKVYGPPYDYAKQQQREWDHWSNMTHQDYVCEIEKKNSVLKSQTAMYEKDHPLWAFMADYQQKMVEAVQKQMSSDVAELFFPTTVVETRHRPGCMIFTDDAASAACALCNWSVVHHQGRLSQTMADHDLTNHLEIIHHMKLK